MTKDRRLKSQNEMSNRIRRGVRNAGVITVMTQKISSMFINIDRRQRLLDSRKYFGETINKQ